MNKNLKFQRVMCYRFSIINIIIFIYVINNQISYSYGLNNQKNYTPKNYTDFIVTRKGSYYYIYHDGEKSYTPE